MLIDGETCILDILEAMNSPYTTVSELCERSVSEKGGGVSLCMSLLLTACNHLKTLSRIERIS